MRNPFAILKDHIDYAIDAWMVANGGNREHRLRRVGRSPDMLDGFIEYQIVRARSDDTVFGVNDPNIHYLSPGLDFVSQYLRYFGFKDVVVIGSKFTCSIEGFGRKWSKREFALPAYLEAIRKELETYKTATASQVTDALHRARIYLYWAKRRQQETPVDSLIVAAIAPRKDELLSVVSEYNAGA